MLGQAEARGRVLSKNSGGSVFKRALSGLQGLHNDNDRNSFYQKLLTRLLWGRTYLCSLYKGAPKPIPGAEVRVAKSSIDIDSFHTPKSLYPEYDTFNERVSQKIETFQRREIHAIVLRNN